MSAKKLIVACDGTWVDSDNGFERSSLLPWSSRGHLAIPSNVTRLTRALLPSHTSGTPQIAYYQAGLGSADNAYSYFIGGYLGVGISENIREAYSFLCNNYVAGDEIYVIGFSRGAFTARSIAGLISAVGLLTKTGLVDVHCIFRDWQNQNNPSYYQPTSPTWVKAENIPEPRPDFRTQRSEYIKQLVARGLTRDNVPIEAVAVWDTVGTLGVPQLAPWPLSLLTKKKRDKYSFVDTEVPATLKKAYQALALDERRMPFSPTVWEAPDDWKELSQNQGKASADQKAIPDDTSKAPKNGQYALQELRQCWFPGTHSGVGGGYADTGTADIALAWLVQQLSRDLSFDPSYLAEQKAQNQKYLLAQKPFVKRPWGCGKVYGSGSAFLNWLTGAAARTPGRYTRMDPMTGQSTGELLRHTNEFVHPCVRVRRALKGLGTDDKGVYNDPWPLKGWTLVPPGEQVEGKSGKDIWGQEWDLRYKWVLRDEKTGDMTWIAEEQIDGVELDLVNGDKDALRAAGEGLTERQQ